MKQTFKMLTMAALGGIVSLGIYSQLDSFQDSPSSKTVTIEKTVLPAHQVSYSGMPAEAADFTTAAHKSLDAVVHVKTISQSQRIYNPWSRFFGGEEYYSQEQRGSGSGVIISGDGYIVTNNHVVANASTINVTLNNNRTYEAKLIGTDPATDVALLKIDAKSLPAITLGDSDHLQVGEWVLAVGNPFNLTSTVTAGIVSAKARNINIMQYDPASDIFPLESFIQTDAAVNPGNSGGALVNTRGELVGINTAIASRTGSYSGYSFAIPVSIVQKVVADLVEYGSVQRAYIGVSISNVSQDIADEQGIKVLSGAYVRELSEDGAATDAGIKPGDIIVRVQGIPVENTTQLQEQIGKYRPGDKIEVTVLRDQNEKQFDLVLRDRYGNKKIVLNPPAAETSTAVLGAKFAPLSDADQQLYRTRSGAKITELQAGALRNAGVREGFVITRIDRTPISSPEEAAKVLSQKKGGTLIEGIYPDGATYYYGIGL